MGYMYELKYASIVENGAGLIPVRYCLDCGKKRFCVADDNCVRCVF